MIRIATLLRLWRDTGGAAAAEMVLVVPLLLTLLFGAFETGKLFWDAHIVTKAVRDGARYASRRSFADYAGCAPSSSLITEVREVTRTGVVTAGSPVLRYWTNPATITVSVSCGAQGTYRGVYEGLTTMGPPVVTIDAAVPYRSLFANLVFRSMNLTMRARSQAAVAGL